MLPKLTLDNGNDENEDAGDENENASENGDRNENVAAETGTQAGEKADIIEKNKATTHPFAIFTDTGNKRIPAEKSPENSTLAEVMTREEEYNNLGFRCKNAGTPMGWFP